MAIKNYNKLSEKFKEINNVNEFKKMLKEELLSKCIYEIDEVSATSN